jgi:hypothetical protein
MLIPAIWCQAHRTGNDEIPLMTADRARLGEPADDMRGKFCINAPNSALSSSVCAENLNPDVVMVKSTKYRA